MKGFLRQKKVTVMATLLLSSAVFQIESAIAAPILDQSFDASGGSFSQAIYSGQSLAQTFTVGKDGYLDTVGLMLNRQSATTSGDFTLNIFSTTAGAPDEAGPLFFSQSYSVFDLPGTGPFLNSFTDFDTSSANIAVSVGDVLAISVTHQGGNDNWLTWDASSGGYSEGMGFNRNGLTNNLWASDTQNEVDRGFRTFVDTTRVAAVSEVPEPSALSLFGLSLAGLYLNRRRNRSTMAG